MVKEALKGSYLNLVLETSKKNDGDQLCTFTQDLNTIMGVDFDNSIILVNDLLWVNVLGILSEDYLRFFRLVLR